MFNLIIPAHDVRYFDSSGQLQRPNEIKDTGARFNVNGYTFICHLRQSKKDPRKIFGEEMIHAEVDLTPELKATILARPIDYDRTGISSVIEGECALGSEEHAADLERITNELETIAQFSGRSVELVVNDTRKMVPPKKSSRTLFVILGSVPPGYPNSRHATHLFGTAIAKPGYRVRLPAPTIDTGFVVKNDLGEPIAQIVDDSIYLFVPINSFGITQLVDQTVHLFRRSMNLVWNAYIESPEATDTELKEVSDSAVFAERALNPERDIKQLREKLDDADERIHQAQCVLTDALAERSSLVATIAGMRNRIKYDPEQTWEQLQAIPFLDRIVEASNGGVYYISKPLVMLDEDQTERYIGPLGLSIEQPCEILVWSIDNPHPSGVPHPHVSRYGDVCLGNVTQSVAQLMSDQKEAETAALVLRMLAEGYDPVLTEHKLNEWPTPEQHKRRMERESIAPVPHVEREPDSTGDDSGSRLDRLFRRFRTG